MKKGDKLFVRIDYKIKGSKFGPTDFEDHLKYLKEVASKRYFIGGGFSNRDGGMIVFEAKDLEEAIKIASNDPIIKRKLYTYELFEWDLVILSDEIQKDKCKREL